MPLLSGLSTGVKQGSRLRATGQAARYAGPREARGITGVARRTHAAS
jgi:hypothetical protein